MLVVIIFSDTKVSLNLAKTIRFYQIMDYYLSLMLRAVAVYLFMLLAIRLFGKKELAQLSVIDLVFILLISNAVQNAMVGSDSTLVGGLAAATGLFLINYVLKIIDYRFPQFSKAIQGEGIMLVYE